MAAADDRRPTGAWVLAGIGGYVDAAGYLTLDVFPAHMSGNSARIGVYVGRGSWATAAVTVFAVAVFVASIATGALVTAVGAAWRWRPHALLLIAESCLIAVAVLVATRTAVHGRLPRQPAGHYYLSVACLVGAMGAQTATLRHVAGRTVRTTFVSGMLASLADEAVTFLLRRVRPDPPDDDDPARGRSRIALAGLIWLCYVVGAIGGALLHRVWEVPCLVLPAGLLIVLAGVELRRQAPRVI